MHISTKNWVSFLLLVSELLPLQIDFIISIAILVDLQISYL